MKCPKCGISLLENVDMCPFCKTPLKKGGDGQFYEDTERIVREARGKYSTLDPDNDSYDFDLQYTLTFKDAGEIRKAIADMEVGTSGTDPDEMLNIDRSVEPLVKGKPKEKTENKSENIIETSHFEGSARTGENGRPRRTEEEMRLAAARAEKRREMRKNKELSKAERKQNRLARHEKNEGIKNDRVVVERMDKEARRKASAVKAVRQSARNRSGSVRDKKSKKGIMLGTGVAIVVVALIFGAINLVASMVDGEPVFPTVYMKGNGLYLSYDKQELELSSSMISEALKEEEKDENKKDSNDKKQTADDKEGKDTKDKKDKQPEVIPLNEKNLVTISSDGLYTYFFENFNMNTKRGTLAYVKNDKKKSKTVLADNVYYAIEVSKDGKSVLYLKDTNDDGDGGQLQYWNVKLKQPEKVEDNICKDNFVFAQDGLSAMFIKNFNPDVHTGDLCLRTFAKGGKTSDLDKEVSAVFGTTPKGKTYIYSKNYDKENQVFDVYSKKDGEEPALCTERTAIEPILLTKSEAIYSYANSNNGLQNLYFADFASGNNRKIASDVSKVEKLRKDEGAVVYSTVYDENIRDYYFVTAAEANNQKIANNVLKVEEAAAEGIKQFDISDDFSRVAYIAGFDLEKRSGALYTAGIVNGYVGTEKRISDNVCYCDVSSDGAIVRFAANYSLNNNTVDLVSYSNSATLALTNEVGAASFTFDADGDKTVCARDYSAETRSGNLEYVDKNAKTTQIMEGVHSYGLKRTGETIFTTDLNADTSEFNLYTVGKKGGSKKIISEKVTQILKYKGDEK